MATIPCFLIEETGEELRFMRRYHAGNERCPGAPVHGYTGHNARRFLGRGPVTKNADGHYVEPEGVKPPDDDPRWPSQCESCSRRFTADDPHQLFTEVVYCCTADGEEVTLRDAPPGAMWRAWWYEDAWKGPDGHCYVLNTPGGEWCIDGPSANGDGWTREGTPPNITANPSILAGEMRDGSGGRYHGFLRSGQLVEAG